MAKVYFLRIDGVHAETGSKGQLLDSIRERFGRCVKVDNSNYVGPNGESIKIDERDGGDYL